MDKAQLSSQGPEIDFWDERLDSRGSSAGYKCPPMGFSASWLNPSPPSRRNMPSLARERKGASVKIKP
jgi:hypothetical protein